MCDVSSTVGLTRCYKTEGFYAFITKITLTISNAEHIKQTLSTNKTPYRHQHHLPKISKNVSEAVHMSHVD